MDVRRSIKNTFGLCRCIIAGVKYPGGVYIGRHVNFANGKNIQLEKNIQIRPDCDLFAGDVFIIGEGTDIGTRNRIAGNVIIEKNVLFGPDNFICSYDHNYTDPNIPIIYQGERDVRNNGHKELYIREGSWIGTHCAIVGDVHIGKHCIVVANSVVTRDIPDYSLAAGNPAKIIKQYNFETGKWERIEK